MEAIEKTQEVSPEAAELLRALEALEEKSEKSEGEFEQQDLAKEILLYVHRS